MRSFAVHKKPIPNFYGLYNKAQEDGLIFTDPEFPHDNDALYWKDAGEVYAKPDHLAST